MTAVLATGPEHAALTLEPEQTNAVILLASGVAVAKVAERLGVDRRTVSRWREQPAFAAAFEHELAAQAHLMREAAQARLVRLTEQALDVVEAAMANGGSGALAAARLVLTRAFPPDLPPLPMNSPRPGVDQLAGLSDEELDWELDRALTQ